MSLLDDVPEGVAVGLDTAPVIYFIEAHPQYGPIVLPLFDQRFQQGLNKAVTSVLTLAEVLVKPLTASRADLCQRFRELLTGAPNLQLFDVGVAIAEKAADLRARYGVRLPDACQVAVALAGGASYFITNDKRLRCITELKVLVLNDYLPGMHP
jgi:predicted nucleic acid-binding protein